MATLPQALDWVNRGLPIFPLDLGDKRPRNSFPEQATLDPERVRQIWADPINGSRDLNIGVLMGKGHVLFDIDTKNDAKYGHSAVQNYINAGGTFETLTVKTASGGFQCYFKLPPGMEFANATNIIPGVDDRCENGYGIAPGSFSIESGGAYELYRDLPIADIPLRLLALLKPVKAKAQRLNGHGDSEKSIPLYVEYLKRVPPAIEGQNGNNHTYAVACMGVNDYGLTTATVANLMAKYFNDRCEPPWEFDELVQFAEHAEAYSIGRQGSRDPDTILEGVHFKAPEPDEHSIENYKGKLQQVGSYIDLSEDLIDEAEIPQTQWLMHPMLAPNVVTVMAGPGGVGKSTFLLTVHIHAAVGKPFGPYTFSKPVKSLLYTPEDSRNIVSGRAAAICQAYGIDHAEVKKNFKIYDMASPQIILGEMNEKKKIIIPDETLQTLATYFKRHPDTKLLSIDPLRMAHRGINENAAMEMTEIMRNAKAFAQVFGLAVCITHHLPKGYMQRKDLDKSNAEAAVGSGAVTTSARLVVNIMPQSLAEQDTQGRRDNIFSIQVVKNSYGPLTGETWWERVSKTAANGEKYPAVVPVDVKDVMSKLLQAYMYAIGDFMIDSASNGLGIKQAAVLIREQFPESHNMSDHGLEEQVRRLFQRGGMSQRYTDHMGMTYQMYLDTGTKPHRINLDLLPGQQLPTPIITMPPRGDTNGAA